MAPITTKKHRFTVAEYLRMDEAGIFEGDRVELLMGRIVKTHAQADPHMWCVTKTAAKLLSLFPASTHWVVVQGTLYLGQYGAPDPDFHVFDVPAGTPDRGLPFVVIEVSDSTYRKDSTLKTAQYASAGVQDYWIVNIPDDRVEVYRQPGRGSGRTGGWGYADVTHHIRGVAVALLKRPDVLLTTAELLP